jgi:hypothetical protein
VSSASLKAIRVVVASSAVLLLGAMQSGAVQTKVDEASTNPAPANPAPPSPAPANPAVDPGAANTAPAPGVPAWRDKQVPEWTEGDAKQLLSDSPWAKSVVPTVDKAAEKKASPSKANPSGRKFIGIGGFGIGGKRSESSSTDSNTSKASSGGAPPGSSSSSSSSADSDAAPPTLRLRWESALPIREAELKAKETGALAVDEDHYAIAVYGVPSRMVNDSKKFADELKAQAVIKRDAKEDMKPSSVVIRVREDGPVVLYVFPRTEEITWRDHQIEFNAQIGPLKFKQAFASDDMRFHGELQL